MIMNVHGLVLNMLSFTLANTCMIWLDYLSIRCLKNSRGRYRFWKKYGSSQKRCWLAFLVDASFQCGISYLEVVVIVTLNGE